MTATTILFFVACALVGSLLQRKVGAQSSEDESQIRDNLQAIINQIRAQHPEAAIIVAGMQLPGFSSEDYVSAFGAMFAGLAQKNRATLIPFFLEGVAGDPALNQWDRVHPNAAGQRVLAENVWRVLEPMLRKTDTKAH